MRHPLPWVLQSHGIQIPEDHKVGFLIRYIIQNPLQIKCMLEHLVAVAEVDRPSTRVCMEEQEVVESLLWVPEGQEGPRSQFGITRSELLFLLELDALVAIATCNEDFLFLLPLCDKDAVIGKVVDHELIDRGGFNLVQCENVWIMSFDNLSDLCGFTHLEVLDVPRENFDAIRRDALLSAG